MKLEQGSGMYRDEGQCKIEGHPNTHTHTYTDVFVIEGIGEGNDGTLWKTLKMQEGELKGGCRWSVIGRDAKVDGCFHRSVRRK